MRMHFSYNMSYCYPKKNEQERVKTFTRILNFLCYNRNVQWFYVHNFSQKVPLFVKAGSHLNESASFPRSRIRARMGQSGSFQHIKMLQLSLIPQFVSRCFKWKVKIQNLRCRFQQILDLRMFSNISRYDIVKHRKILPSFVDFESQDSGLRWAPGLNPLVDCPPISCGGFSAKVMHSLTTWILRNKNPHRKHTVEEHILRIWDSWIVGFDWNDILGASIVLEYPQVYPLSENNNNYLFFPTSLGLRM